ncbi:MAG: Glycine cleavage system H protein [candidate division BRC1 bacterium ADurb.BinA364]|nr:MAG: Glycine cleavage system H protein [candidate division BRC1 bacterium ADurb.BinA364]
MKGATLHMDIPDSLLYLKSHEWARIEGDICTVGISDFAVEELNKEIVNVDLPEIGATVKQDETFGILDAVKAAFDLYAPMSGVIAEVNEPVLDDPVIVAKSPYIDGWLIKIKIANPGESANLMNAEAYRKHIESESSE